MSWRLALVAAAVTELAGCRCDPPLHHVDSSYRVVETTVDFGRVLENQTATRTVTLQNTGRGALTIAAQVDEPFDIVSSIELAVGAELPVEVTFTAGFTEVDRTLTFDGNQMGFEVHLHAVGVRPKDCRPSGPCREVQYVLATDACVETVSADGALCTPTSQCLENGQCVSGQCQGTARACSDTDLCTLDGCSEVAGCVHTQRACPPPTHACRLPSCDPATGCGEMVAPDGTVCGPVNCIDAMLCVSGECQTLATPEGTRCAPSTPCQGEGACRNHLCVRPDAGPLARDWVVPLPATPAPERPAMLVYAANLYLQLCGFAPDAGPLDAGSDGGDGGDGGGLDGGGDAGTVCALVSYTPTGFERYSVPFTDGLERQLVGVGPQGATLLSAVGLDVHALGSGALRQSVVLTGATASRGVAIDALGTIWAVSATDGGTVLGRVSASGFVPVALLADGLQTLALDEAGGGVAASLDGGQYVQWAALPDAGLVFAPGSVPSGGRTLAVAGGSTVLGDTTLLQADGGQRSLGPLDAGAQSLERLVLLDGVDVVQFERRCEVPVMSCLPTDRSLWVRVSSLSDGATRWQARVATAAVQARLEEASLATVAPGAVVTLSQYQADAGGELWLEGWVEGQRAMACRLPPGGELSSAVFGTDSLFVLRARDGGSALETYPLTNLELQQSGWPQADGLSGQRRAR